MNIQKEETKLFYSILHLVFLESLSSAWVFEKTYINILSDTKHQTTSRDFISYDFLGFPCYLSRYI